MPTPKKILTWFLIGILLFQQIFYIPFSLPSASALEVSSHEDVVALVVEKELQAAMSDDIEKYALRVQSLLPQTRTVILSFPRDTHPFLISSALERLYYSGIPNHGKKSQRLTGAILIGHVPLPVVHRNGTQFLSIFPYTDFDEPHFSWNWDTEQYDYISTNRRDPQPDIWHSVIDPNTGSLETDVSKIQGFFARVYEYDAKEGRYADVGEDPQVLYMDSVNEGRSSSKGLLASYEQLYGPYQEDFIYHRYTREFAQYLYENFLTLMRSEGVSRIVPFSEWKKPAESNSTFLDRASDITTRVFAQELIVPFVKVINEKYLGDVARWVHNTGRYYNGYSEVRLDSMPELITKKDALATQIIKETNDTLEKMIDRYVDSSMSLDIPILLSRPFQKTIRERDGRDTKTRTYNFLYKNHYSGTLASDITDARSCSLLRGSSFAGINTQTEMNHAYNVAGVNDDMKLINIDSSASLRCDPLTQSYWGGNSPMNTAYQDGKAVLGTHRTDDFPVSILDDAGGKRTTGTNFPLDCLRNDLILDPYKHNGLEGRRYLWPAETKGERYSCVTKFQSPTPSPFALDPTPENQENILTSLENCDGTGKVTLLGRTGSPQSTCTAGTLTGTYKRISSLVKHADPTREIYGAQVKAMTSPNLPVDGERYLLYLDRDGREARIDYPNVFDITVAPTDTDEIIIQKITTLIATSNARLVDGKDLSSTPWSQLVPAPTNRPELAAIILSNPDLKAGLVDALRWKSLDIENKYAHALDLSLSKRAAMSGLLMPEKKDLYEISYLGGRGDAQNFVFGFSPDDNKDLPDWFQKIQNIHSSYEDRNSMEGEDDDNGFSLSRSDINRLTGEGADDSESDDTCGDPEGVVIWEWPEAIQCWLSDLLNNEWFTADLDEVIFPTLPSIDVSFGGKLVWSTKQNKKIDQTDSNNNLVTDYVEKNREFLILHNTFSDTIIRPKTSFRIDTALEDASSLIDDDMSQVRIEITRIDDLVDKKIYTPEDADWNTIRDSYVTISGSQVLRDGHAIWMVQSRSDRRARIHIETHIYDQNGTIVRSEKTVVLIGETDVPLTVVGTTGTTGFQTVTAGDAQGLKILLGGTADIANTADVVITDYVTGEERARFSQVRTLNRQIQIGSPAVDTFIRRAGKYRIQVTLGDIVGETTMTIVPAAPEKVNITTPSVYLLDQPQRLTLDIVDIWGNIIPPTGWNIAVDTSSNVIFAGSGVQKTTFSGAFKTPLLVTPKNAGNLDINATLTRSDIVKRASISRQVVSNIRLVTEFASDTLYEVGQELPVKFSLQRADGSIIESWNDPLPVRAVGGNAKLRQDELIFKNGRAEGILFTGTRPATVNFSLSDVGLGRVVSNGVKISAGAPIRFSVTNSTTVRAKPGVNDTLRFSLYDAYGNLTDIRNYSIHIETDSTQLIEPILAPKMVSTGVYETLMVSRGYPGRMLIRSWLQVGEIKSTIPTLENVSMTTFLPVIDSADAQKNSWQTLTQVLLGGPFGQTPTGDYLAGSLLFAPDTKTLSVTTLVDTVNAPIVALSPRGGLSLGSIEYGTGIRARVDSFQNGILNLLIADNRLGNIARITYPALSSDALLTPCQSSKPEECNLDTMTFVPTGKNIVYKEGVVSRNGSELFIIRDVFSVPNLTFSFVDSSSDVLQFSVKNGSETLGVVQVSWSERMPSTDAQQSNTYRIQSLRSNLAYRSSWTQASSYQMPSLVLYDPQASSEPVGGAHRQGWSQYPDTLGLGWTDDNVSLLQFASGQEWSVAQRDHEDYLSINIGDPLIRLPNYNVHPVTGLDHTLGTPVYQSNTLISDMTFSDVNNDTRDDLILFHDNGTVGTRLTRDNGDPLDVGDLFAVQDAADGMIRSGDFMGDGYSDIVYVDTDGTLRFVSYDAAGPTEIPLRYEPQPLLGEVMQLEVFDMDHDDIDDIITMDHLGTLSIFYGQKNGIFITQVVDHAYDFVFSKEPQSTYFVGGVRYAGTGFRDPGTLAKPDDIQNLTKQERINQSIFMDVQMLKTGPQPVPEKQSLGTVSYESLNNDVNGFMRGYDGDAAALGERLKAGYDALEKQAGERVTVSEGLGDRYDVLSFLRAPFIDQKNLLVTKKYASLEESGKIVPGSPIQATMYIKNTSSATITNLLVLEKFPDYLDVTNMEYSVGIGTDQKKKTFILDGTNPDAGIIDLRDVAIAPGQTYALTYEGTMRSFTFGRFDVGFLEDAQDPNQGRIIPKEDIRTINAEAGQKEAIPESAFYNSDVYGDIRFNPNETCGGPILLWRSHNTYDRTYHKTIIVRDVQDPEKNAVEASEDPTSLLDYDPAADLDNPATLAERVKDSKNDLAKWQADGDGDTIPDASDDDHGDLFEIENDGTNTRITIGGNIDKLVDQVSGYVQDIITGLSCGFGSAGCVSMPINWAANAPGNTIAFMGYALPGANTAPVACHNSVLCGTPTFAYPTDCCSSSNYIYQILCQAQGGDSVYECTWPDAPEGAGGLLDYMYMEDSSSGSNSSSTSDNGLNDITSSSGQSTGKTAEDYEKGLGISDFRTWTTPTLTGAVAQVMCFGANDSQTMNRAGIFPFRFDGNCIFATAPVMQCSDDGSQDTPLTMEMDINYAINDDNRYSNADECHFYEPLEVYPADVSGAVSSYLADSNDDSIDSLRVLLDEHPELAKDISHDNSLGFATLVDDSYERLNNIKGLAYESQGNGNGLIQISLDPSELKFKNFGRVVDIEMKSIRAFPNFIMDWVHRQLDEIVSSIGNMPDIKIVLPQITGIADPGWISAFGEGAKEQFDDLASNPFSQTSKQETDSSTQKTIPQAVPVDETPTASAAPSSSTTASAPTSQTNQNFLQRTGSTLTEGYDKVVNGYNSVYDTTVGNAFDFADSGAEKLGTLDAIRDAGVGAIQQKTTGIQNAFEYLGTLPIIDVHPETISFTLPWIGKQEAQAWLARNEAILEGWKNLPASAVGSVDVSPMISSIESNIETVKSYLELPEKLQNLFYLKEKLLYGVLQNVQAVQDLMGGWLYENGQRFRAWVEAFILTTKLWDLWQIIIDIFDDYEAQCGVCINERWNLKQWLWIVISMVIPEIPVITMPRWPDIELDFSDIDLSLDVAYPVFDLSFYPVYLPDAPLPTVSGFPVNGMPQLPPLPDLNIDIDIPAIQLPDLPDLPPPPKIPELSQSIETVLEIFKLVVMIECLYKQIPLSPEWVVGTKVAHKTERQGYLPFDFLDVQYPTVNAQWIDTIRVATSVNLNYDVTFVTDMIRSALEPLTEFPMDFSQLEIPSSVNFDIKPEGVNVESAALHDIPTLLGNLFALIESPTMVDGVDAQKRLTDLILNADIPTAQRERLQKVLFSNPEINTDLSHVEQKMNERFTLLGDAITADIESNKTLIADLGSWSRGEKNPEEIAFLSGSIPGTTHLAAKTSNDSQFLSLDREVFIPLGSPIAQVAPATVSTTTNPIAVAPVVAEKNSFTDAIDTKSLRRTKGLYVVNGSTTQRLLDYTEDLPGNTQIRTYDDDRDGDEDVYYTLGDTVYRKENYQKNPEQYFIKDSPRVYQVRDIYFDFFNLTKEDITNVFTEGQIDLLRTHSKERINMKYFTPGDSDHVRLDLYGSLNRESTSDALYRLDMIPKFPDAGLINTGIVKRPYISDIDGQVTIHHKKIYRTLLPGQKYLDENGATQSLSSDFVIRANQSGYARESSTVMVVYRGTETRFALKAGDRLFFSKDSQVRVTKGSLILLANTAESRVLSQGDIGMPLLDGDRLMTSPTGSVDIIFEDATKTRVSGFQEWVLTEYDGERGIHSAGIDVKPDWYYGVMVNARTLEERRMDRSTIFNASTDFDTSDPIAQIPRNITLLFDRPTTIDFQSYFPADAIDRVEVYQLASSQWRRDAESPTKLVFLTQKEKKKILLRITVNGRVHDYTTNLVTETPKMVINSVTDAGALSGSLSIDTLLPMGIQTLVGTKPWSLASGIPLQGRQFSASLTNASYGIGVNKDTQTTINRTTGTLQMSPTAKVEARIALGKPLTVALIDNGLTTQLAYQSNKFSYTQVASVNDAIKGGISLFGPQLRLEPTTLTDKTLPGGVYITDTEFRPVVALDVNGYVRYLDGNVVWTASVDGNKILLTLTRDHIELGKLIVQGDMITTWRGK